MKTFKDSIAIQTEAGLRRDSHAEAPPWDLIYQTLLAELDLRVEDAVARALSAHGLAPPPIGGVVINTRKNRHHSSVLGPATLTERNTRMGNGTLEEARGSGPFGSSPLPPWLQPFAHPEKVRFTRTPDSFLRPSQPPEPLAQKSALEDPDVESGRDKEALDGGAVDAETLMNAGTPSWRIPVTLPPNVRFNRTPLRRSVEDVLPLSPEPTVDALPTDRPVRIMDEAAAFVLAISDAPATGEAGPATLLPPTETASTAGATPGVFALEALVAEQIPEPWEAASQAPEWFDFFGAGGADDEIVEPSAPSALDDHPIDAPQPDTAMPALPPPPALLMLAPPVPSPAVLAADVQAPQTLEPEVPPTQAPVPPVPAWFDFFGAANPQPAGEQDNVGSGFEGSVDVVETDPGADLVKVFAMTATDAVTITITNLEVEPDLILAPAVVAEAEMPPTAAAPDLIGPEAATELTPKPTGIASPEDARAFVGLPRDYTARKPSAAPHGLAPFEMTNAITSGTDLWVDPPLDLLVEPPEPSGEVLSSGALEQNARLLEGVLEEFGIRGEIIDVRPGPVVTLYEFEPAPGTKSSRVIGLSDDIARSMSAVSARVAVVQGRNVIGIELPNQVRETVFLSELISSSDFLATKHKLAIALGKTIGGEPIIVDLARMPHLLVAGTTGSGKSVAINTMILSILYRLRPEECRLIMVDPKMLELSVYEGIPHLLTPVVTDPKKAVVALKWAVREMEDRYKKMSKVGVRNIDGFNARVAEAAAKDETITRTVQTGYNRETGQPIFETEEMMLECLPYIVVVVDEMADLMMVAGKDIEGAIQRLAQMARAAGIHLIMATQRPSVDVITGTIKANFPTRISFQVTSKIDSRTILGEQGAEQLLGQGDMLYMAGGGRISRVHGPFVSDGEVEKVVAHLKTQGHPAYLDVVVADEDGGDGKADGPEDKPVFERGAIGADEDGELYDQAVKVVLRDKKCSTSYIQRRLQVGYNKAASLVERMEKEGIVGQANNAGKREILVYSRDLRYTETKRDGEE